MGVQPTLAVIGSGKHSGTLRLPPSGQERMSAADSARALSMYERLALGWDSKELVMISSTSRKVTQILSTFPHLPRGACKIY